MNRYPVWIDCDVGCDDAIAILLAHGSEEIDLLAISTVAGNASLDNTFRNAHRVNGLIGAGYPIYAGADRPLLREAKIAPKFHGVDGLGEIDLPMPENAVIREEKAWDALYAQAKRLPGQLRLVAIGPLTNVAIAFTKYPDLPKLLHSVLIMGGGATHGNRTPAAEFNIYADPEAAKLVFEAGCPIVMCGLDVTMKAYITQEDMDELYAAGTPAARFPKECLRLSWAVQKSMGLPGAMMHDSCPVMYILHPEYFSGEEAGVVIETRSSLTLGKTVTDLYSDKQFDFKNALVLLNVDRSRFVATLKKAILSI